MSKPRISFALAAATACVTAIAGAAGWDVITASGSNLAGETHVVKTGLVTSSALQSFSLDFTDGDHKIYKLGLLPSVDRINVAMADKDGGNPFKLNAKYTKIPWNLTSTRVKKAGCYADCKLDITRTIATNQSMNDMVFVLRGFYFEREKEANVRRISIRPNVADKKIDVMLKGNTWSKFDVTIDYTLIHKSLLQEAATASAARKNSEQLVKVNTQKATGAQAILSGFDFEFDNGDHHLKQFTINRVTGGYWVAFNDQNTDDPYRVTIDYAGVKE